MKSNKNNIKRLKEILSIPFIYGFIIPAVILDIAIFIYQNTAIRLYWIPLAKRSDYIVWDRAHLDQLTLLEKINCVYCSYVNWLFSYAAEVWGRTEKYWCPIKHKNSRVKTSHAWQPYFADFWDYKWFQEQYWNTSPYYEKKSKETM